MLSNTIHYVQTYICRRRVIWNSFWVARIRSYDNTVGYTGVSKMFSTLLLPLHLHGHDHLLLSPDTLFLPPAPHLLPLHPLFVSMGYNTRPRLRTHSSWCMTINPFVAQLNFLLHAVPSARQLQLMTSIRFPGEIGSFLSLSFSAISHLQSVIWTARGSTQSSTT